MEVGWIVSGSELQSKTTNGKLTRQFKSMYMLCFCFCVAIPHAMMEKQHFLEMYW